MRNLFVLTLICLAGPSMGEPWNQRSRIVNRGSSDRTDPYYRTQMNYSNESRYGSDQAPYRSRYENSHDIYQDYSLTGPRNIAGAYGERGQASRTYEHNGDPQKISQMERKEAHIEQFHHSYVDQMGRSYRTLAESKVTTERLRGRVPQSYTEEQNRADANLGRLMNLYRDIHRDVTEGR